MPYRMSKEDWEKIHKSKNTCIIGMVMNYKHDRISSSELMDIIAEYIEYAHHLGVKRGINISNKDLR